MTDTKKTVFDYKQTSYKKSAAKKIISKFI